MQIPQYKNIFFARKTRVCLHMSKKSSNFAAQNAERSSDGTEGAASA